MTYTDCTGTRTAMPGQTQRWTLAAALICALTLLAGCAPQRPVLYPNDAYNSNGPAMARQHVDQCMQLAKDHGLGGGAGGEIAGSTVKSAAVGAAVGGAAGAVRGRAGRGAAIGAAGAGTGGFLRGVFRANELDPTERAFVQTCLSEKGYKTIGWK